tara:strand:- start:253 stop:576 length:324 start_codon:yes stop_codon:yes gene_type:complete
MNRYSSIKELRNINPTVGTLGCLYRDTTYYPEIPFSEDDIYVITDFTDRYDTLAERFYGDITLWWIIPAANPSVINFDSLLPGPGTQLRIPTNLNDVLMNYKKFNDI